MKSSFKLVTINQRFIAETIARTGSEEMLRKALRNYVGLYDEQENWYIPLRARLSESKPQGLFFVTPFTTSNPHFIRPGLDFQKALFVPVDDVIEIRNTLPLQQSELIFSQQDIIRTSFERYIVDLQRLSRSSPQYYLLSTVPLFPDGVEKILNRLSMW